MIVERHGQNSSANMAPMKIPAYQSTIELKTAVAAAGPTTGLTNMSNFDVEMMTTVTAAVRNLVTGMTIAETITVAMNIDAMIDAMIDVTIDVMIDVTIDAMTGVMTTGVTTIGAMIGAMIGVTTDVPKGVTTGVTTDVMTDMTTDVMASDVMIVTVTVREAATMSTALSMTGEQGHFTGWTSSEKLVIMRIFASRTMTP